MAEVSNNASRDAVLSGGKGATAPMFDLRSWQGLTDVLRFARDAGLSDAAYGDFRNLVLGYAQSGGNPEMRAKIDAVISSLAAGVPQKAGAAAVSNAKVAESVPQNLPTAVTAVSGQGVPQFTNLTTPAVTIKPPAYKRPAPSFMPKSVAPLAESEAQRVAAEPRTPEVRTEDIPVAPEPPQAPVVEENIVPAQPPSAPEPTLQAPVTTPLPTPEPAIPVVPPVPEIVKEEPTQTAFKTLEGYKNRIAEIKRAVNAEVGNPVMLIDDGNPLGREYMTALLTAMKALGNGGQGIDEAMTALESVYVRVLEVVKKKRAGEPVEAQSVSVVRSVPQPEPVQPAVTEAASVETAAPTVPDASDVEVPTAEAAEEAAIAPSPEESHAVASAPQVEPRGYEAHAEEEDEPEASSKFTTRATIPLVDMPAAAHQSEPHVAPIESMDIPVQLDEPAMRVMEANKHTESGLGRAEYDPTVASEDCVTTDIVTRQSDLVSPEITSALAQLLREWSLFESSGLFGIGPGGVDHPLYKKLAGLSMGEVLAGRFEGATSDLRRTLKDYVDAWRHEQGVAYNPTETFEHYLRRVVQRILKRQKGEAAA